MSDFYAKLREQREDSDELAACIEETVDELERQETTARRPGILLGKIQSGMMPYFSMPSMWTKGKILNPRSSGYFWNWSDWIRRLAKNRWLSSMTTLKTCMAGDCQLGARTLVLI